MAKRNLRIVKRVRNIPVLGICEYCNAQFAADPIGEVAQAQSAIQQRFNAHTCKTENANQAAVRTVEKAKKD